MKKMIVYLSIGMFIIGLVTVINAKPFGKFCDYRAKNFGAGCGGFQELMKDLNLTQNQIADIAAILKTIQPEVNGWVDDLREQHKNLAITLHEKGNDATAVRDAYSKVSGTKEEPIVLIGRTFDEVQNLLTEEQIEQLRVSRSEILTKIDDRVDFAQYKMDRWIEKLSEDD